MCQYIANKRYLPLDFAVAFIAAQAFARDSSKKADCNFRQTPGLLARGWHNASARMWVVGLV